MRVFDLAKEYSDAANESSVKSVILPAGHSKKEFAFALQDSSF